MFYECKKDKHRGDSLRKILVTTAWPYGNGPIHLGHFAGMVLPADIFARYHRLCGNMVAMVSGTDMHGTPISIKAEEEGMEPEELAEKYHTIIKKSLDDMSASYDLYTKTNTRNHYEVVQDIFATLRDKGYIYKKEMKLPYCSECDRFLPDRYVEGICPMCDEEDARGDQCDECGMTLDPMELDNSYCTICGKSPVARSSDHYFLKLTEFSDFLKSWISTKKGKWKSNVINFTEQWIEEGLEDRPITRDMGWGVPIPGEEEKDKSIYVWFDAVIGYLSATKELTDEWKELWKDENAETYYFIGKDNIPFHAIIWPSILKGYDGLNLPHDICANEFLNLEGRQFSTSRNWAVWLNDIEFDTDSIRYYLTKIMPEKRDSNFKWEEYKAKNNDELVSTYGNFIYRVLSMVNKKFDSIPYTESLGSEDKKVLNKIDEKVDAVGDFIEEMEFKKGLNEAISLASTGNAYLNEKEPWNLKEPKDVLFVCTAISRSLAIMTAPFLPKSAQKLWNMLGLEGSVHEASWEDAKKHTSLEGKQINNLEPLFEKLDDKEIEKEIKKLGGNNIDKISIQEFERLDMRIGEVIKAEEIEGSDKLLKLKVDIGEEKRQLVAGLSETHSVDELLGKKVVVLANLEEAEIFGVKSEGMVLAAEVDDEAVLIEPEKDIKSGSGIC